MKLAFIILITISGFIANAEVVKLPSTKAKKNFVVNQLTDCYYRFIFFGNHNDFISLMCSKDGNVFYSTVSLTVMLDATKTPRVLGIDNDLWGQKILGVLWNKEQNILIGSYLVEEKNNKFKPKIGVYNLTTAKVVKEYDCVEDFFCSLSSYDHKKQVLKLIKLKTDKAKTLDENIFKAAEMLKKKQGSEFEMKLDFVL